jgi:hypothetical protein
MKSNFGREVIIEENERPCRFLAPFKRCKSVPRSAQGNVPRIVEASVAIFLAVDLDKLPEQGTVMCTVKDVRHFTRLMLVLRTILVLLCDLAISSKSHKPWDDGDISEFFAGPAVGSTSILGTIRAFVEARMRPDVANTRVDAAIVHLRLKASQEVDPRAKGIEFGEGRVLRECVG